MQKVRYTAINTSYKISQVNYANKIIEEFVDIPYKADLYKTFVITHKQDKVTSQFCG